MLSWWINMYLHILQKKNTGLCIDILQTKLLFLCLVCFFSQSDQLRRKVFEALCIHPQLSSEGCIRQKTIFDLLQKILFAHKVIIDTFNTSVTQTLITVWTLYLEILSRINFDHIVWVIGLRWLNVKKIFLRVLIHKCSCFGIVWNKPVGGLEHKRLMQKARKFVTFHN